ncbi:MAG: TPM domain-containing protein [Chitinophagaceae bacterium]|nr:TPM domain-containing protein [Chitinophagaceae bacterium]
MAFFISRKAFLNSSETEIILDAVRNGEKNTSGEIRLYIESRCRYMDPGIRAQEIFVQLQMHQTIDRNGVLIYIAYHDRDFALIGDKGIFEKTPTEFWRKESLQLSQHFSQQQYVQGICKCVDAVAQLLKTHFPTHGETKNELPDEIIFGK